jgi:hypothetical protein
MADELITITIASPLDTTGIARRLGELLHGWLDDIPTRPLTVAIALTEDEPKQVLVEFAEQMTSIAEFGGTIPRPDIPAIFIRLI